MSEVIIDGLKYWKQVYKYTNHSKKKEKAKQMIKIYTDLLEETREVSEILEKRYMCIFV